MSFDTKKLQEQIKSTLSRISELDDATVLKRLHANIHRHPDLEDIDRETLDEAVMQRLRIVSPAIATRLGGPKDEQGRDFLEALYERVATEFDLSGNHLKNGVKTGGYMINGTRYVDVYISYKTATKKNLSLAWIQDEVGSEPYLHLQLRHVGAGGTGELKNKKFNDQETATEAYSRELAHLLSEA
ncbi:hypothetical protein [Roseobacter litoralis]|uniref:Uncharacterized protein n=1 Tax=Roseobacter litoralis (strain ATCC 49566 / DSM 6996 / JCM 21268 / NBRC 15278 / OCh 149) TaxID=391595 RepID=F7ZIN8_ROSLO|nr:hypothetical protein [Roseobacter litoralis]AEI93757.1 hypothetical protein RLO149_c017650 [Roseobacter litoralis Och 149]